ncbi:MAG: TetR/AcrR family transcriptional regulator [Brevinematales bacterium]|nr:TetR/AcrR family transcriptional regulator [Brevinematales bacterium]
MRQWTKRQKEIIEFAIKIIVEEGLDNFTTKNLALKLGISEAALYRHFDGKNEIISSILEYFEDIARDTLRLANKFNKSIEKLRFIFKTRAENFVRNPGFVILILSEEIFPPDPMLTEKIKNIMLMNKDNIEKIIQDGQKNGEIRNDIDKETLFYMVVGSFRFMITRWRLMNFSFDLIQIFNKLWEGLEKLLKKEEV